MPIPPKTSKDQRSRRVIHLALCLSFSLKSHLVPVMNAKSLVPLIVVALASGYISYLVSTQQGIRKITALRSQHAAELSHSAAANSALEQKLQAAELERDHSKRDAAEIHKLRAEISTLRKEVEASRKTAAATPPKPAPTNQSTPSVDELTIPASFANLTDLGQFAATLRTLGSRTPEQIAWAQQMKPELEKLEQNPQEYAAFQAAMIEKVAGITDPQKTEQIRDLIQKTTQVAVNRGLNLQARPEENDSAWVQNRHQLDRRGTSAVQKIMTDEERAAFDRSFLGVIGIDLGTGVDKSLYPPGFLAEAPVNADAPREQTR